MSTKLFTLTSLLALTSALPSGLRSTLFERRAATTECDAGTWFYKCSNGYVGCFNYDPCSLPKLESTATTSPTVPSPTSSSSSTPTSEPPKIYEITKPRSYNIYHSEGQTNEEDKVPHVDLVKAENGTIVTSNAMIFDNVPAGAKNCRLNWRHSVGIEGDEFTVEELGQAFARPLTGFPTPPEKVSFNGLKKYQDTAAPWSQGLDFQNWPGLPAREHYGPSVPCGTQVAVEVKGSEEGVKANRVYITNTKTNGFYLSYSL
ncbi:hypothetical protein BU23DRAFT_89765 [Bimuria novae-zelandiae CBS 107.79]|uniref:Uncharacterized protein n=1 Tax=Bimuria novae-zelandiae CBS 107.79 TaxID=1447943 RepID=A0A6A5VEC7_9PLEO|nr:hypothetical protein BU23DRAFT_89765 [Bimuria novae-zelandiae CBS 107.79]